MGGSTLFLTLPPSPRITDHSHTVGTHSSGYLVGRQEAEYTPADRVTHLQQQGAHLVLEGKGLGVLERGTQLAPLGARPQRPHPDLQAEQDILNYTHSARKETAESQSLNSQLQVGRNKALGGA